jgi:tetratricopeptide (TPR) repeat protein
MNNHFLSSYHEVLEKLGIDRTNLRLLNSQDKRAHYRAVIQWLSNYEVSPNSQKIELLRGYIEASYHLREIDAWEQASILLQISLNNGTEFHEQLGIWGNYLEQIELYEPLIGKFSSELDSVCLNGLGDLYLEQGYYTKSIKYYENLLVTATTNNLLKEIKIKAFNGLGKAHLNLGNRDEAHDFYTKQLATSEEIRSNKGVCLAYLGFGDISTFGGDFAKATDRYLRAMQLAYALAEKRLVRMAIAGLGGINTQLGLYDIAIAYHKQELELAIEDDDRKGEVRATGSLGNIHYFVSEYKEAISLHERSLQVALAIGDREGESIALGNLGIIHRSLGNYDKASIYHQQSLTISREIQLRLQEANTLLDWGVTAKELTQNEDALEKFQESLSIFNEIDNPIGKAKVLKELAQFHMSLENLGLSKQLCEQALEIFRKLKIQPLIEACQKIQTIIIQKEQLNSHSLPNHLLNKQLEEQNKQISSFLEILKIQAQNMNTQGNRFINTDGGNYVESNEGTYVQGNYNYINSPQDLSQAAAQIQQLLTQLQTQGVSPEVAIQQVATDLSTQAKTNSSLKSNLIKWGQSLGDTTTKTTIAEAVKFVISLALTHLN